MSFSPLLGQKQATLAEQNLNPRAGGGKRQEIHFILFYFKHLEVGLIAKNNVYLRIAQIEAKAQFKFYEREVQKARACLVTCRQIYSFFSKAVEAKNNISSKIGIALKKPSEKEVKREKQPEKRLKTQVRKILNRFYYKKKEYILKIMFFSDRSEETDVAPPGKNVTSSTNNGAERRTSQPTTSGEAAVYVPQVDVVAAGAAGAVNRLIGYCRSVPEMRFPEIKNFQNFYLISKAQLIVKPLVKISAQSEQRVAHAVYAPSVAVVDAGPVVVKNRSDDFTSRLPDAKLPERKVNKRVLSGKALRTISAHATSSRQNTNIIGKAMLNLFYSALNNELACNYNANKEVPTSLRLFEASSSAFEGKTSGSNALLAKEGQFVIQIRQIIKATQCTYTYIAKQKLNFAVWFI